MSSHVRNEVNVIDADMDVIFADVSARDVLVSANASYICTCLTSYLFVTRIITLDLEVKVSV